LLDDLDYFPFPKKWLEEEVEIEDEKERVEKIERMNEKRR
jgi:hypothetical protein